MATSKTRISPKYKIGQLASSNGEFGVITGIMNRGGVFAYEVNGTMTAEDNIEKVYSEVRAAKPRASAKKAVAQKLPKKNSKSEAEPKVQ